jgi:hypothetical protein
MRRNKNRQNLTIFLAKSHRQILTHYLFFVAMRQQLLFTLFSALVHSSFGSQHEYDIFCDVGGDREASDCHVAIPHTNMTLNHLVIDAIHSCVREVTHDNIDIEVMEQAPEARRQLRVKAMPQARLLGACTSCCCSKPACMIQGLCGSSRSCGSQSCNRRLDETANSTTGVLHLEEAPAQDPELSAKCTESMRVLSTLFGWNNKCLGSDPSTIECSVSENEGLEVSER